MTDTVGRFDEPVLPCNPVASPTSRVLRSSRRTAGNAHDAGERPGQRDSHRPGDLAHREYGRCGSTGTIDHTIRKYFLGAAVITQRDPDGQGLVIDRTMRCGNEIRKGEKVTQMVNRIHAERLPDQLKIVQIDLELLQ